MHNKRLNRRKLASAVLLLVLGLGAVLQSLQYSMGDASRMGPGYFPLVLGVLLALLGLLIFILPETPEEQASQEQSTVPGQTPLSVKERLRPWLAIVSSMLVFIFLGKWGGLVPATFMMVLIATMGDKSNTFKGALCLAGGITVAAVAMFHYGLQMQFPLFTWGWA